MFKHCNSCCQSADIIFLLTFSLKVQFIKEAGICSLSDPGNILVKLIMMTSCQCCLLQGHHQHQVCHTDIISSNELILSNKVSLNDILVILMNLPALLHNLLVRRKMFEKHLKMYMWIMKLNILENHLEHKFVLCEGDNIWMDGGLPEVQELINLGSFLNRFACIPPLSLW